MSYDMLLRTRLNKDGHVLLGKEWALVPEFSALADEYGQHILVAVALLMDYRSAYRFMDWEKRVKEVFRDVGFKGRKDIAEGELFKGCIEKYRTMYYNSTLENLRVCEGKIREFNKMLEGITVTPENAEGVQKIMVTMDKLMDSKDRLIKRINEGGDMDKVMGGGGKVLAELWMDGGSAEEEAG